MSRVKVILKFPKRNGAAIIYARHILASMTGNAYFPSPPVPLATLSAQIDAFDAAEIATLRKTLGTATERDAQRQVVVTSLETLRVHVETVANQDGENAMAIAASSGMSVKRLRGPKKWLFAVGDGRVSGTVWLKAPRAYRGATYKWQYSTDGIHWIDAPDTSIASTTIDGLTPGLLYSFRYRTFARSILGDWSDVLTHRPS